MVAVHEQVRLGPPSAIEIQVAHGVRISRYQDSAYLPRIETYRKLAESAPQEKPLKIISSEVCGLKYCVPGLYEDR